VPASKILSDSRGSLLPLLAAPAGSVLYFMDRMRVSAKLMEKPVGFRGAA
jgi:hypothetical protein